MQRPRLRLFPHPRLHPRPSSIPRRRRRNRILRPQLLARNTTRTRSPRHPQLLLAKRAQRRAARDVLSPYYMDRDCRDREERGVADRLRDRGADLSGVGAGSVLDGEGGEGVAGGEGAGGYCEEVK